MLSKICDQKNNSKKKMGQIYHKYIIKYILKLLTKMFIKNNKSSLGEKTKTK